MNLLAFFGIGPIELIIIAILGLGFVGVVVVAIVLSIGSHRKPAGARQKFISEVDDDPDDSRLEERRQNQGHE